MHSKRLTEIYSGVGIFLDSHARWNEIDIHARNFFQTFPPHQKCVVGLRYWKAMANEKKIVDKL